MPGEYWDFVDENDNVVAHYSTAWNAGWCKIVVTGKFPFTTLSLKADTQTEKQHSMIHIDGNTITDASGKSVTVPKVNKTMSIDLTRADSYHPWVLGDFYEYVDD